MSVLNDMSQQARVIASQLSVKVQDAKPIFITRETTLQTTFDTQLTALVSTVGTNDYDTTAIDAVHADSLKLISDIQSATSDVQKQMKTVNDLITQLRTWITNIQNTTDFNELDASSKHILLDFAKEYRFAYAILWAKIILVAALLFYLRSDWKLFCAAYVAVYICWILITTIITIFKNIFRKRTKMTDLTASKCSNVGGRGCPETTPPSFIPCADTDFGCCGNGLAAVGDTSTCGTLDCWNSAFGCCSDGVTAKKTKDDTCGDVIDCDTSSFGCCPNGMPRVDAIGSNCTMNSSCGYSAYGCCNDGSLRIDATGSNCVGATPPTPLSTLNSISLNSVSNPFTDSGRVGMSSSITSLF